MPKKALNLTSYLAVLVLLVTAFLLSVGSVSGKSALGGSGFGLGLELEKSVSNSLLALEKSFSCRTMALGICDGPDNNTNTNISSTSNTTDNVTTRANSNDVAINGGDRTLWGNWNDYPKQTIDTPNGPQEFAVVGDRLYSQHAVARMQPSGQRYSSGHASSENHNPTSTSPSTGNPSWADGIEPGINVSDGTRNLRGRSIAPSYVEDIIKNNQPIKQPNGNLRYEGGSLNVIVSPDNKRVISIINVD